MKGIFRYASTYVVHIIQIIAIFSALLHFSPCFLFFAPILQSNASKMPIVVTVTNRNIGPRVGFS